MSDKNPQDLDPITQKPGSHPVGTGVGATGGAIAGVAAGSWSVRSAPSSVVSLVPLMVVWPARVLAKSSTRNSTTTWMIITSAPASARAAERLLARSSVLQVARSAWRLVRP